MGLDSSLHDIHPKRFGEQEKIKRHHGVRYNTSRHVRGGTCDLFECSSITLVEMMTKLLFDLHTVLSRQSAEM